MPTAAPEFNHDADGRRRYGSPGIRTEAKLLPLDKGKTDKHWRRTTTRTLQRVIRVRKSPGFHGVHLVVVIVRYIFEKPSPSSPEIASNKREAADPGVGGLDNVESQSVFDSPTQPRCALAWARQRSWIAEREILSEVWRIFSPSLPSCISRPFALFHISDSRYIFRKPGPIAQTSNFSRVVHSFALVY